MADRQVKIRDLHVDLREVEAEMAAHPAVRQCLVTTYGDGDARALAAYVVCDSEIDDRQLRVHLAARLPAYMVPAAFVFLSGFRLDENREIDSAALPPISAPAGTDDRTESPHDEPPQGELECAIAAVWTDLLGIGSVSRHRGFFEAGGNSLLVTRMAARLRDQFGADLPVPALFAAGSIAELAAVVRRYRTTEEEAVQVLGEIDALDDEQVARLLDEGRD
jgi:hypothetical protein